MDDERQPISAGHAALDRQWRRWATSVIVGFVVVSGLIGFLLLPESPESALGIPRSPAAARLLPADAIPTVAWDAETRRLLETADVQRGADVAQACVACHGTDGVGIGPVFPNLAGQTIGALFKQLVDYRSGGRRNGPAAAMVPFAMGLGDQQVADVSAYYASRDPGAQLRAAGGGSRAIEVLVRIGDPARALAPCAACHGADAGGPPGVPPLEGQPVLYLEQQLAAFASGERRNDIYARMRAIARALTPEEIQGLARYYGAAPASG